MDRIGIFGPEAELAFRKSFSEFRGIDEHCRDAYAALNLRNAVNCRKQTCLAQIFWALAGDEWSQAWGAAQPQ